MTGSGSDWAAVGRILGERRRALGLPKNEAARRANLSNTTWRLLEAGVNHNPTDETLVRVSRVIKVEPETLFRAAGRPEPGTSHGATSSAFADAPAQRSHHESAPLPRSYPRDRLTAYFVGRREALTQIAGCLENWEGTIGAIVLTGPPGVGKTEVAARYVADHRDAFDRLWWVNAGAPKTAVHDLRQLAEELGIAHADGGAGDAEVARRLARRLGEALLADGRRWLIVIDAVARSAMVEEFLRTTGRVRVLLTSRQGGGWHRAWPLPINPLPPEEAAEFLRQRTGSLPQQRTVDEGNPTESSAEELAAELGHLPLALERAGAYVDKTGISLRSFLNLLRTMSEEDRLLDLLDQGAPEGAATPASWLGDLRNAVPARSLLRLLAFLSPEPLDLGYLTRGNVDLPPSLRSLTEGDLSTFGMAAQTLRRRSLVVVDDAGLRVHPIVQADVRRSLTADERKEWANAALNLLLSAFPPANGGPDEHARTRGLLAHVQAATRFGLLHGGQPAAVAQLLSRLAERRRLEGDLVMARRDAERALELLTGMEAPAATLATVRQTLALIHVDLGEFEPAREQFREAYRACEAGGVEPHTVALLKGHLAATDSQLGWYDPAWQRLDEVLAFLRPSDREQTAETAEVMSVAALTFCFLDEIDEARRYFGYALTLRRALQARRDYSYARDCYGLARVELLADQPHRAAYWFQLGLDIFQELYGCEAKHPKIGDGLRGLAAAERKAGNPENAIELLDRAAGVYESVRGFDHHPVRKSVKITRELLEAWRERASDRPDHDSGSVADGARADGPLKAATERYIQQKAAIGNDTRGFHRAADAVTALRLGEDLLDVEAFDSARASFETCARLAQPDSLLELKARMRRAHALERSRQPERAREEYQLIIQAIAAIDGGAEGEGPSWTKPLRARAEQRLGRLAEKASAAPGPLSVEAAG
jgi:tetratricopeptide (TPR) repeat protein/transcriptional regulator with XRE-family HTH domain